MTERTKLSVSDRKSLKYGLMGVKPNGSLVQFMEKTRELTHKKTPLFSEEVPVVPQKEEPDSESLAPHLWMFNPERLDDLKKAPLTKRFFGKIGSDWIAASAQAEVPQDGKQETTVFSIREQKLKERRLTHHPEWSSEQYDQIRAEELAKLDIRASRRVNRHFSKAVAEEFGISGDNVDTFAATQYRQAALTMQRITDTLYPHIGSVNSRNESSLQPPSPAKVVRRVNSPKTNGILRFEEVRRQLLAHVSAQNELRHRFFEAGKKMTQIQELLDQKLFSGREGDATTTLLKGIFANETNIVQAVMGKNGEIRNPGSGEHMKVCAIPMRSLQGFENDRSMQGVRIYTHPNTKTRESSDIKALRKAADEAANGKSDIITADTVRDRQRLGIMVHGDWKQANKLFDRVWEILQDPASKAILADMDDADQPIMKDGKYVGSIIDGGITEDSKTNGTSDQGNPKFRRIQVQFEAGDPVEIQITTAWDFFRNEYEVGTFNAEKGRFVPGVAHELYDINRLVKFRENVLPQKIYNAVDLNREAIKTMKAKAKELIGKKRAKMRSTSL